MMLNQQKFWKIRKLIRILLNLLTRTRIRLDRMLLDLVRLLK